MQMANVYLPRRSAARTTNGANGHSLVTAPLNGGCGQKVRTLLRARLGEDVYTSWFNALEIESFDGMTVRMSVPQKFLRNWIESHYTEDLLTCCRAEFTTVKRVDVVLRHHTAPPAKASKPEAMAGAVSSTPAKGSRSSRSAETRSVEKNAIVPATEPVSRSAAATPAMSRGAAKNGASVSAGPWTGNGSRDMTGLEGSPLDPKYTFDSFVAGGSNRIAHAAAAQVAETLMKGGPGFNPLYIHSPVGLGKTHLLHAIAWDVKRLWPDARVLYLTAERFRYQFVEALRSQDPLSFKDKFRSIDMLLVDDFEFMQGERTEQEFDHILNAFLDGGRQVVVASARAASQMDRLNERMRSRLQRGLVTEIGPLDYEVRLKIVEKRLAERRTTHPAFAVPRAVQELVAQRLTESGRELEGAVTRLHAAWQYEHTVLTVETAERIIRDLVQTVEPRRIKIDEIQRIVSKHYGVSKEDLLAKRRTRSVVWPRQIAMYLAKHLTARSLPEIGRLFGNRDHTTVLHAVRKIEGEVAKDPRLKTEIEDLKRQLGH